MRPVLGFLALASVLLSRSPLPATAATRESTSKAIEAKIALESSLEKRLRQLLTEVLGSENLVVIINVDLYSEEEGRDRGEEILPGVPLKETAIPGALGATLTMVKKIKATIILDESTRESDIQLVRKVAGGLLGVAADRGEAIAIEKMRFRKGALSQTGVLGSPGLWNLLWFFLAAVGLGLLYAGFLARFLQVGRDLAGALRSQGETQRAAGELAPEAASAAAGPAGGAPGSPESNGARDRDGLPFSFVKEEHLPKLLYLLRKGSPEHIAMVAHYLPPHMATQILASQDESTREKVAQYLVQVTELKEAAVREMEKWIRSRIDFLVGGEEKLGELLDRLPPGLQEGFLSQVAGRDSALSEKLRARVVELKDLAALEPVELQAVLRRVPLPVLAQVLKTEPGLAEKILAKVPAGIAERLTQEMALSRDLPRARLEAEMRRVLDAVKALAKEGWIVLKKGGSPPPPEET